MKKPLAYTLSLTLSLCGTAVAQESGEQEAIDVSQVTAPNRSDREYRYVRLDNGLRALLIHDADTDKSAASLNVQVGAGDDPTDRPGLAHFLEHMLFLGTEPFPEAGEYQAYLSRNGGSSNAFTSNENTNYFFDVDDQHLQGALDRFAAFFTAPLLNADKIDRERNAVHSEYTSKIQDDSRRYFDALKQVTHPEHPFSNFSVGNLTTLSNENAELRDEVAAFWRSHYSANLMTLAVLGREPLDVLERWVQERFGSVPNSNRKPLVSDVPLLTQASLGQSLEVQSLRDTRSLQLIWPVPNPIQHYDVKPTSFIGHLLGHEGVGSPYEVLRSRGWIESLSAGLGLLGRDGGTFMVGMELTPEGANHRDEIIEIVFDHIRLIETQGVQNWRHREKQIISSNEFIFSEDAPAQSAVRSLTGAMVDYPIDDILRAPYAWDRFDEALIRRYLAALTPDNLLVSYMAQDVQGDSISPWYDTPYSLQAIPQATLNAWTDARTRSAEQVTTLPEPNGFIATDFTIRPAPEKPSDVPVALFNTEKMSVWHLQDTEFNQPKAQVYVRVGADEANDSPQASVAIQLVARVVKDRLNAQTYSARLAGLGFDVYRTLTGVTLTANGYSQAVSELALLLTQDLSQANIEPARFEVLKNEYVRELKDAELDAPYTRLMRRLSNDVIETYYPNAAKLEALETLDLETTEQLWQRLLDNARVDVLVEGNMTAVAAETLARKIATRVPPSDNASAHQLPMVDTKLSGNERTIALNFDHDDSAWVGYFPGPNTDPQTEARLRLLAQMLQTPFYTELRTVQQLGYIVFAGYMPLLTQPGIVMVVQSPETAPEAISEAAQAFLKDFAEKAYTTGPSDLETFKAALVSNLTEDDPSLGAQARRHWNALGLNDLTFDRREQVVEAVKSVTIADIRFLASAIAEEVNRLELSSTGRNDVAQLDQAAGGN